MQYNVNLPYLPKRTEKPRKNGVNMVMDKGLSLRQTEDLLDVSAEYIDFVKFGFGTALITPRLKDKIALYKSANIRPYLGGTFFEAFVKRQKLNDYIRFIEELGLDTMEVSDGSITLNNEIKCEIIQRLSKIGTVFSEVGSKEAGVLISPNKWKQMMTDELSAGAWKVIAESRESGTVGIYRPNGKAHVQLINKILAKVKAENIIWEAPVKAQQAYWIKLLGTNVNLGNIAPEDVIPLETLRLGMRGDTFFEFLPTELKEKSIKNSTQPKNTDKEKKEKAH